MWIVFELIQVNQKYYTNKLMKYDEAKLMKMFNFIRAGRGECSLDGGFLTGSNSLHCLILV